MRRFLVSLASLTAVLITATLSLAYVEAPHTLGLVCRESTNIVLVEVARVNKDKGLIIYRKLQDLKGKHPTDEIKHNIGQRGFHPREWQNVMNWAEVGKKAVFFHNGGASETCTGSYWYQCYNEGEWWGMSHAEPFLLRTYCGDPEKLATAVTQILQNKEVIVPCFADGNKEQLHLRKGKLQRLRASLKLVDYDQKRDFVTWGGDGDDIEEYKTIVLLAESTPGWRFLPAAEARNVGERWRKLEFGASGWREGKVPIGYGEDELNKREGTLIDEKGQDFLFRRVVNVPTDLLNQKGVTFRICIASDDSATVWINGELVDKDPEDDHEFSYWNRDIELQAKQLKAGPNLIAAHVKNRQGSSDLYFDAELSAQWPLPKPVKKSTPVAAKPSGGPVKLMKSPEPPGPASQVFVDKKKKSVAINCFIAPRKIPTLQDIYPLEVIATFPAPAGQKAHETVVVFNGIRPSDVHKALEELGLKPGKPAKGDDVAEGPELRVFLEVPNGSKPRRIPIEQVLIDKRTGKPIPALKWFFTGSTLRQPDPEKDEAMYGADLSGTLIAIFPVTDETVIQSSLSMKDEAVLKLERVAKGLPEEGGPVRLVIEIK